MAQNREIKAGLGYTIGNILIKGITFITLPIFSRILSQAEYGIYSTYTAYENILSVILGLGLYASLKSANIDYKKSIDNYVKNITFICTLTSIVALFFAVLFNAEISAMTGFSLSVIVILILHSSGSAFIQIYNAKLTLTYDYVRYLIVAAINAIGNVLTSLLLIYTIFNADKSTGRILGYALPIIMMGWLIAIRALSSKGRLESGMMKYALAFGLPLVWHLVSQTIESQIDRIMIERYIGATEAGIYSLVYTIAMVLQVIFYSTDNVWSVWVYSKLENRQYGEIKTNYRKYIEIIAVLACFMALASRELLLIMGGTNYLTGALTYLIVLDGIFLLFLYTLPVCIEYYLKQTQYIALVTFVAAITNIVLNAIFIPRYGYQMAAYTTFISYAITFFGHYLISKKLSKKESIDFVYKLRDFLGALIMVIVVSFMSYVAFDYWLIRYGLIVIIAICVIYRYRNYIAPFIEKIAKRGK